MTIRLFLFLATSISILALPCTNVVAKPIDQPTQTIKQPTGQLDFSNFLNAFFNNNVPATRQILDLKLEEVTSQLGNNLSRAEELGFGTNPKEATVPNNTLPFLIFHVGLNDLRNFDPSKEASDLLIFTNQLLFPVEIKNKVASSVTVRLFETHNKSNQKDQATGWQISRWGLPKLIGHLDRLMKKLPPETLGILVSIPSLNYNFLGYVEDADLKLVRLAPDQSSKEIAPLPAKKVFLDLVQEAKSVDGSPR